MESNQPEASDEGVSDGSLSDEALLAQIRQGSEAAFGQLLDKYYALMFRTAYKWCGHQHDAEEIAQEACIKIGASIADFRAESALSSWIYRIVVNLAKDRFRRVKPEVPLNALPQEMIAQDRLIAETSAPDKVLENEQLWYQVRHLPEKLSSAVMLVYSEGLTHAETADVLGCAESTVSWYILEAKKLLSQRIASNE